MTSCSKSRGTPARCTAIAASGCRPARPPSKPLWTSATGSALDPTKRTTYLHTIRRSRSAHDSSRTRTTQRKSATSLSPTSLRHEFPTHRMLQELMMLDPIGADATDLRDRHAALPWCADGNYGCLFDGTSQLSLTGKIAHFELGYIPESAKVLRAAAGFLITNHTRKHIMTLPRAIAEAERLRGSRALPRHPRRRGNREGELRADAEVQLLEHLHRPAICAVQAEPHPLRRVRQQPPVLHHAAERPRRPGGHGAGHRAPGSDEARPS